MTNRNDFANPPISNPQLSAEDLQKILSLQGQMLEDAVVNDDHEGLLDKLCLLAESFTPNAVATVMLLDPVTETLFVENAPSLTEEGIEAFNGLRQGDGSCGNAVYHKEAMYVCNTFEDHRWTNMVDVAQRFNICSCFSFPIFDDENQCVGSFAISSFEHRDPEGFHRALLETCTSICGVILQRRRDRDNQRRALNERITAKKLSSLGVLAGGIAHDFNNLLGSILGSVDMAATLARDGECKEHLEWAIKAIDRASQLTQQLLTFSRGGAPIRHHNDICSIVHDSAQFALRGSNVALEISPPPPEVGRVQNVDGGQISQLIQNLVINSRQAMPDGGNVAIRYDVVDGADGATGDGRFLMIDVVDDGPGMEQSVMENIFDPYFTTSRSGTGLGLTLCYAIAKSHGGRIEVESELGKGSRFSIFLPHQPGLELNATRPSASSAEMKGGRAIVMDDEPMIRRTVVAMMEHLGFEVLEACHGAEVLTILESNQQSGLTIDLVILDLTIPGGMGGVETKERVHELAPDMRVVVSSGYSADHVLSNYKAHGFAGAVTKPYRLDDLRRVVAELC